MPGLIRAVGRTAVVAGTATAVSNRVSRRQAGRWSEQEQQEASAQQPPPPQQYQQAPPPPVPYQPAPQYQPPPPPPEPTDMNEKLVQLQQLGELKTQGLLTEGEFENQKQKILNS
jgi:Short C-terminal domain